MGTAGKNYFLAGFQEKLFETILQGTNERYLLHRKDRKRTSSVDRKAKGVSGGQMKGFHLLSVKMMTSLHRLV